MAKRKVFHVTSAHESGWNVRLEGSHRNVGHTQTKQQAIKCSKQLAKQKLPSQVVVHKKDGRIQTEYTYGNDPRRSKG